MKKIIKAAIFSKLFLKMSRYLFQVGRNNVEKISEKCQMLEKFFEPILSSTLNTNDKTDAIFQPRTRAGKKKIYGFPAEI